MPEFQTSPGMRDILPPESTRWRRFQAVFASVVEAAGYGEIIPPMNDEGVGGQSHNIQKCLSSNVHTTRTRRRRRRVSPSVAVYLEAWPPPPVVLGLPLLFSFLESCRFPGI